MHRDFAAAAQRQAADRRDDGHVRVAQLQHRLLHELLGLVERVDARGDIAGEHALQVGAGAERVVARPDHQALVLLLGQLDRHLQAFADFHADRMHLGLDADDHHFDRRASTAGSRRPRAASCRPCRTSARCCPGRLRGSVGARTPAASGALRTLRRRIPRTFARVHATGLRHRPAEHPVRQRRLRQRLARGDVFLDPVRHLQPAGLLPQLEGPCFMPKPQRMAKSTSRAVSAMDARCTAA